MFKNGYQILVVDPFTAFDLQSDSVWVDSAKYSEAERLHTGEIGKWFGCRVVTTTQPYRTDTSGTQGDSGAVHWNLLIAREAYGITRLKSANKNIIIKIPGPQDTSNPLNRYNTAGWVQAFVSKTLNANFGIAIKTGATA
jgi:N4-gp56 family major capsid protein